MKMALKRITLNNLDQLNLKLKHAKECGYDAFLLLGTREIFFGHSVGYEAISAGELCFTTSMTGYQHTITDPSFAEQIIVFTFPHIGNVGVNNFDNESTKPFCNGIVLRDNIIESSHHLKEISFKSWLKENKIPCICGVDTRSLTKALNTGNQEKAVICAGEDFNIKEVLNVLRNCQDMENRELSQAVCGFSIENINSKSKLSSIVLIDFGVKESIIRNLEPYFDIEVVPGRPGFFNEVLKIDPDGIVFSNGPGDPKATYNLLKDDIQKTLDLNIPMLGVCLGHQLISISFGLYTKKMDVGHRGCNHPVYNLLTKKVEITSQNHGFVVINEDLPSGLQVTHISLFDDSIEGLKIGDRIFSYQHHPEGGPGPFDSNYIFEDFSKNVIKAKQPAA